MIGASLYIARCAMRNRLRVRLRRLRQPRYLIGAIVGAAYLYLTVFARRRSGPPRRRRGGPDPANTFATMMAALPPVVATVLLGLAAAAWVFPFESDLIEFSDAEVDFLFTAPVRRRQLFVHRLVRTQAGLLFASTIPVVLYPGLSPLGRIRSSAALWLLLLTIRLYFTGVTLARRGMSSGDGRVLRLTWLPAAAIAAAVAAVAATIVRTLMQRPAANMREVLAVVSGVASAGWPHLVLGPFIAIVHPLLASDSARFAAALPAALLVAVIVAAWAIAIDERTYELSGHSAGRTGSALPRARPKHVMQWTQWPLAPVGRAELALAWRAATELVRGVGGGAVRRPATALALMAVVAVLATRQRGAAQIAAVLGTFWAAATLVLGPQMLRIDLRQDLQHLDVLKTWPLRGSAVVRGEMLCPTAVLTVIAWAALAFALAVSGAAFARDSLAWRVAITIAAAIAAPAVITAQLTIHNAAALAFPAWVATGTQRPRGLDAMGQRLILLGATMLLLVLMLAPGAAAGAAIWIAFRRFVGAAVLVPAAAAGAFIVFVEVLVATEAVGGLYDRVDLAETERADT